jgi:hypothetical protein
MRWTRGSKNATGNSNAWVWTSCGSPMKAGPQSAGSSIVATAWGSDWSTCSGRTMRSQNRVTGRNASLAVMVGSPKCSTCCSTGSFSRLANVSPESSSTGRRLACAMPAAVTMLSAPGPIELVATMICRRRMALANPIAAMAIVCSFWPRHTGSASPAASSASPREVTFPWPKMANTPGNNGTSASSTTVRWAIRNRTMAWATVSLVVSIASPVPGAAPI